MQFYTVMYHSWICKSNKSEVFEHDIYCLDVTLIACRLPGSLVPTTQRHSCMCMCFCC